jgi:SAM-dependent methyltransferase
LETPRAAPEVLEDDPASLGRYLLSFRWPYRDETISKILVKGGMPLWRQMLDFVPNPKERGRALELGSPPFHITLLMNKLRNYDLQLSAYPSDERRELVQEVESPEYGERHRFVCACFDAETERFPFDDDSFDLVIWSEVIEHLTKDPVHTLGQIHRVLKPGGCVVISTPNSSRADNVIALARGHNIYDPYHLGAVLGGSRHSREYTYQELTDLVKGCGFAVDRAEDIDIYPTTSRRRKIARGFFNRVLSRVTNGHYRYHLFVRARKSAQPFVPYFPGSLFDHGHLRFHLAPSSAKVVMGWNDAPHIYAGFSDLKDGPGGTNLRRSADIGDIYVIGRGTEVRVKLANGKGTAELWHDKPELVSLGWVPFEVGVELTEVIIPISGPYDPDTPVHVRLDAPGGVDVASAEII